MTDHRSEWQNSTQILGICTRELRAFQFMSDFKRKSVALSRAVSSTGDTSGEEAGPRIFRITLTGVFAGSEVSGLASFESGISMPKRLSSLPSPVIFKRSSCFLTNF